MSHSLFCVAFLGVIILSCFSFLSLSPVLVSAQAQLEPSVDRVSATSARVRFLNAPVSQQTFTLIQYTNVSSHFNLNRNQFHACATFATTGCTNPTLVSEGGREINITQVGSIPTTSYILRGLNPETKYYLRLAYIDTAQPPQVQGTASTFEFTTEALSPNVTLNSLVASGGCGSLTSSGASYWLTRTVEAGVEVYTCKVVYDVTNVTLSLVPVYAYATINTTTGTSTFNTTSQKLSVDAQQVDPLTIYTTNIPLGGPSSTTNFSFNVKAESGATQGYRLSIIRVPASSTTSLAGPSSTVTALIRSPSVSTSYMYRALLWSGTSVDQSSWKVWSDDLTVFPFSSFNITFPSRTGSNQIDYTLAQISVSPAASNPVSGSCSNIYVGLFDTSPQKYSTVTTTCVTALDDYCSPTPSGVATKWQTFNNPAGVFTPTELYHPAPPTPGFPAA